MNKKIIISLSIVPVILITGCNNSQESKIIDYQSKVDQAYLSIQKNHPNTDYNKIISYTVKGKKVLVKFKLLDKLEEEKFDDTNSVESLALVLGLPICTNTEARTLMDHGVTVEFPIISETRKKYVHVDCKEVDKKLEEVKRAFIEMGKSKNK